MKQVPILVLDFGSQYTQLIARKLRESGVYTEVVPYRENLKDIKSRKPQGIILSGGPASVYAEDAYKPDEGIWDFRTTYFRYLLWYATYYATLWWKCCCCRPS